MPATVDHHSKRYWRSLERLLDSPALREQSSPEFPDGADLAPDAISRRTMMTLMGASFALAGLTACRRPVETILPYVDAPETIVPGIPQRYATTLPFGTESYGVVVESHEGRPTKVEGNELHPSSGGAASAWMQAAILDLYDPDRSRRHRRLATAGETAAGEHLDEEDHSDSSASDDSVHAATVRPTVAAEWQEVLDFLLERRAAAETNAGDGFAVVLAAHASPTLSRLTRELRAALPRARVVVWEPVGDERIFEGLRRVTGTAYRPVYHLEKARVAVTLDADLLHTESDALRHARGFARARRVDDDGGGMLRLYAVESTYSTTGAMADHRLRLQSGRVPAFAAALAGELQSQGVRVGVPIETPLLPPDLRHKARVIARDLAAAGGRGLLVAGRAQPPAVHALVYAVNRALGAVGETVTLAPLDDVAPSDGEALAELATAIDQGAVDTLLVLGGNPAHDAPAELDFAAALERVEHSLHLSTHRDETTRRTGWHVTATTPFEAWGDARAADGTPSVVQPLIAPLFEGKSAAEILGVLVYGEERSGYELVRATWRERLDAGPAAVPAPAADVADAGVDDVAPGADAAAAAAAEGTADVADAAAAEGTAAEDTVDVAAEGAPAGPTVEALLIPADRRFEDVWRRTLHDGVDPAGAPPAVDAPTDAGAVATAFENPGAAPADGALELTFQLSRSLHDGRFANNAWLQELPDTMTKIVWDNALLISPATAAVLEVENGDVVRVSVGERSLEIPAWILPGQADRSLAIELGYGRAAAGRVGTGVGVDAYPLRAGGAPILAGVAVEKTGERYELVQTQETWSMHGRPLVREGGVETYRADPHFAQDAHDPEYHQPFDGWDYGEGHQWGMAIDLNACVGCNACIVACQSENNIPVVGREQVSRGREMHWLRLDRYFASASEDPTVAAADPEVVVQPVPCMHCENAPCEQVCPVAATVHDDEGLNLMVYNRCIGTRYCSNNCPYKVRRFNFFNYTKETPELLKLAMNPDVSVRSRGVMEKCTYCLQRISEAKIQAKLEERPVRDGEVMTACQQTCPAEAIVFGDVNDAETAVRRVKDGPRDYVLLGELNNRPRTSYQARIRNPNPAWEVA